MKSVRTLAVAIGTLVLTSCSGLHTANHVPAKVLEQNRSSIVTSSTVSSQTRSVLLSSGFNQDSCLADLDACLSSIDHSLLAADQKRLLSTFAELYYAHAEQLAARDECRTELDRPPIDEYYTNQPPSPQELQQRKQLQLSCIQEYRDALYQTIKYSYAYIFYPELTHTERTAAFVDETDVRTQDLYHLAINGIIAQLYRQDKGIFLDATIQHYPLSNPTLDPIYHQALLAKITTKQAQGDQSLILHIENHPDFLGKIAQSREATFSEMISAYDTRLAKLDISSRRSGLGVSFVGSFHDRYTVNITDKLGNHTDKPVPSPNNPQYDARIHQLGHMLVTALILPKGDNIDEVLNSHDFYAYQFDPRQHKSIEVLGKQYPLSANFSAGYALWLSENQLKQLSILNMLAKKDSIALPQLFMLEPYDPNQKVVIMLHGLASSPATWVNLTNTLLSDPELNERYQVWQIAYSTNLPILENRYQIAKLIEHSFASVDPTGDDVASHNAILIGHSMGGVISRLMVSDDKLMPKLQQLESKDQRKLYNQMSYAQKQALEQRFTLNALPQVDTAVFLSAPFRGTDYADRWFTRAARRIIHLPLDLTQMVGNTLMNLGEDDNSVLGSLYLQNGASQLSDRSSFVALTKDVQIHPKVAYHTIMGDNKGIHQAGDSVGDKISDGIVPYSSSHLDGATSETIITGSHNIHENPKTILQLRKILYAHLEQRSD
ncbi:alpha/beta hydrolase [uncultured Moraxella sp.]|uniref:esterase/lipase family protein n=1 Tax=uncultured Moraxella sp. TaxID=263769 RepID=UPI0025E5458A|nr:alpha/beta hydrolase [uncultured Moraxella sp.]